MRTFIIKFELGNVRASQAQNLAAQTLTQAGAVDNTIKLGLFGSFTFTP